MKPLSQSVLRAPASGIRKIFNLAMETPGCIRFIVGEPDFTTPDSIAQAGMEPIRHGQMRYTPNAGIPELRRAIAESVTARKGYSVDPDRQVMVTNGATESLLLCMMVLLDPGDEILMCSPLFSNYLGTATSIGAVPVCVECREENGFVVDPADLRAAVTPRTKAILINSPNNPTGSITGVEVLRQIAALAEEFDLYVISDEVYQDFRYTDAPFVSFGSLPGMEKRTILAESMSKTYAMTGWRVGYLAGPEAVIRQAVKLQENVISCVNASAQYAALEALRGPQTSVDDMISVFKRRRDLLVEGLQGNPGPALRGPRRSVLSLCQHLRNRPEQSGICPAASAGGRRGLGSGRCLRSRRRGICPHFLRGIRGRHYRGRTPYPPVCPRPCAGAAAGACRLCKVKNKKSRPPAGGLSP